MTKAKTTSIGIRNRLGWMALAVLTLLAVISALPPKAEAYHYGYRSFHHRHISSFYYGGYGYGGYGYGGYGYGGYGYGSYGYHHRAQLQSALTQARLAGLGAIDLGVKPKRVEVFVDGEYIGRNGQFDGAPNYLWLEKGAHEVTFYREGFRTVTRELNVQAGLIKKIKFRLEPGDSELAEELAAQLSDDYHRVAA
jgi:hypothetical protein